MISQTSLWTYYLVNSVAIYRRHRRLKLNCIGDVHDELSYLVEGICTWDHLDSCCNGIEISKAENMVVEVHLFNVYYVSTLISGILDGVSVDLRIKYNKYVK